MGLCHCRLIVGFTRPTARHEIQQLVQVGAFLWVRPAWPMGILSPVEPHMDDLSIAREPGERISLVLPNRDNIPPRYSAFVCAGRSPLSCGDHTSAPTDTLWAMALQDPSA